MKIDYIFLAIAVVETVLFFAFMYKAIKPDGYMVIDLHDPEKDIYTLVSNMNPEVWIKKKYMIVKVRLIKGAKSTSPIVKGE